ncbi:Uncharacterised protein [Mycobacteroides abscessus subsp. abscessus]|nr:Uncharacterised protein [Mycobacteroides abscessus subsp. abscessus]
MVLDDIARRPDAVVISCAAAQTDVLGHGDLHMVDEVREGLRRNRQIETVIAAGATFLIEGLQRLLELLKGLVVIETALYEPDSLGKAIPHMLTKRSA